MRGRGLDFEHRFRTSRWAEDLLYSSLNSADEFLAVRFGLSEVRSTVDLVYDKLAHKEPDLLVYRRADLSNGEISVLAEKDLIREPRASFGSKEQLGFVISKAVAAIEVEFSPYKAKEMKGRNWTPRSIDAWEKRPLKNANPPIAPNIWVKEEDLSRLEAWEKTFGVPILIAHIFDQEAFAVSLDAITTFNSQMVERPDDSIKLQITGGIFKKVQVYDRVDAQGAAEKKVVFIVTPAVATKIGDVSEVSITAQLGLSASKKYVSHPVFSGGKLALSSCFGDMLRKRKS